MHAGTVMFQQYKQEEILCSTIFTLIACAALRLL